jgi:hypothetical protein
MSSYSRAGVEQGRWIGYGVSGQFNFRPLAGSKSGSDASRRKLGGQLPPFLEIRSPSLDTRVKIDVPQHTHSILSGESSAPESDPMFTRENTLALCIKVLKKVPDWAFLSGRAIAEGKTLELAWRSGTSLDWVWLEEDAEGKTRDWAVLAGLALKQVRACIRCE